MANSGISWILYAPQFHLAISVVALACLALNVWLFRTVRKIAKKVGV